MKAIGTLLTRFGFDLSTQTMVVRIYKIRKYENGEVIERFYWTVDNSRLETVKDGSESTLKGATKAAIDWLELMI